MRGHLIFNGPSRQLKYFLVSDDGSVALRHQIECHDVGIADGTQADPYGRDCKCPPGLYFVGAPTACAKRNPDGSVTTQHDDDAAYGCWFTPLYDDPTSDAFQKHGRAGIGIHGGGSAAPDPFALKQGWYATLGCLRLQNVDNEETHVPFINYVRQNSNNPDYATTLTVFWGVRGS
jgi:hypothetical protein